MQWSQYSEAIFDSYLSKKRNIIVQACPGAGKTTNIKHIWSLDDKSTVYLVFNKHNELEAKSKLPQKDDSAIHTLNGLGHKIVLNTFGKVVLDSRKVNNIIKDKIRFSYDGMSRDDKQYALYKAVQLAKCIDITGKLTSEEYSTMLSMYDLDSYDDMYDDIVTVLDVSDNMTKVIDFADQLRLPVIYKCNMPKYEVVLGDEVQDFNPIQAELVKGLKASRYVLVGDRRQSLYGFRGAMNNSMDYLKGVFDCIELPLSITYRCAKRIVQEAAGIYPGEIEAWHRSQEGIVRSGKDNEVYTADDIVLCRMNAPLITLAYALLRDGTPCHVRGRDIGEGLIRLIKRQNAGNVRELISRLYDSQRVEIEKAFIKEDVDKVERIKDKYNSALLFCDKCTLEDGVHTVVDQINNVFSEGKGVCLSTVHKAKGLEADRAFLLERDLYSVFKKRARQPWQLEQEKNIEYVAVTRAKMELVSL